LKVLSKTETGISALQKDLWDNSILDGIAILESEEFKITFSFEEIDQVSVNEEWEKNFEAIDVDGNCHVRSPFQRLMPGDIIIEPKMSLEPDIMKQHI
jgi:ribosomal protein L11 methyltransferase